MNGVLEPWPITTPTTFFTFIVSSQPHAHSATAAVALSTSRARQRRSRSRALWRLQTYLQFLWSYCYLCNSVHPHLPSPPSMCCAWVRKCPSGQRYAAMPIWPSTLLVDSLVGLVCSGLFSACWEANLGRFLFVCFIKYRLIFLPISHDYLKSGFMIPLIYFLKVLCFSVLQP